MGFNVIIMVAQTNDEKWKVSRSFKEFIMNLDTIFTYLYVVL